MTAPDKARHLLAPEVHDQVFRERIVPERLSHGQSRSDPVVHLLGGQPGSGKSRLKAALLARLTEQGGGVDIDGDLFRGYHPGYDQLLARDDRRAAYYTDLDAGRWLDRATAHLIDRRVNVVLEGTMRRPGFVAETCARFRGAGYRVEAAILAVPAALSRLGILQRYAEQISARGHGRFSDQEIHDAGYVGLLDSADAIDRGRLVDAIRVYRRGGAPLRVNRLGPDGRWILASATREAIVAERTRRWRPAETVAFGRELAAVEAQLGGTCATELAQIRFLARSGPGRPADRPTGLGRGVGSPQASTVSAPGRMPISTGSGPSRSPSA